MAEEKKSLSEHINQDLTATFDEMMVEMVQANKEVSDGMREEEEKGEEKEIKTEEKSASEESKSEETKSEEGLESKEDEEEEGEEKESEEEGEEKSDEKTSFEPGNLEPNTVWDKDVQEGFRELPERMQEFMLKRYGDMTADYTKKTQEIAGIKRALEPVREEIKEMGIDEGTAVSNLVATHRLLKAKPFIGIQYLMTAYKMSLEDVQANWQDPDTFAQNIKENSRISRIETELDGRKTDEQQAAYEANIAEINEFAKDHPHFDAVEPRMKELIVEAIKAGEPKPSLQSLYDRALKGLQDSGFTPGEKTEKTKTGNDVKKAKKASTRIKSTPKKKVSKPEEPTTLHDDLSLGWDKGVKEEAAGA